MLSGHPSGVVVLFREFEPDDLDRCSKLAAQAWPVPEHITTDEDGWRIFEPYVRIGHEWSNWTCMVCTDSGDLIGLIFGDIRGIEGSRSISKMVRSELRACTGIVLGRYCKVHGMPRLLWNFIMTEMKLIIGRPEADAEIMLLVLDEPHRGKGIGRELVDRFARAAKAADAKRMSVYTDNQASNWRFYEKYGFTRASTFYDNWSSYFEGHRSMGIRFEKHL
jgi:ribosomal protein S18 acetylase RimI-like enzyme